MKRRRTLEEQQADESRAAGAGGMLVLRSEQADAALRELRQTVASPMVRSDEQRGYLVAAMAIAAQLAFANAIEVARMTDGQ